MDVISYEDLETATFHNNRDFVQQWLQNSDHAKGTDFLKWQGNLLRRAAYFHSADVVECILSHGACHGK